MSLLDKPLKDAENPNKGFLRCQEWNFGYKKLLIVTGKGLRSKVNENPYVSKEMSVLKHSVPDFIKQNEDLSNVISRTETASLKDGGEGAFYVYLKK